MVLLASDPVPAFEDLIVGEKWREREGGGGSNWQRDILNRLVLVEEEEGLLLLLREEAILALAG